MDNETVIAVWQERECWPGIQFFFLTAQGEGCKNLVFVLSDDRLRNLTGYIVPIIIFKILSLIGCDHTVKVNTMLLKVQQITGAADEWKQVWKDEIWREGQIFSPSTPMQHSHP